MNILKLIMGFGFLGLTLFSTVSASEEQSSEINLIWRARGLQAMEKLNVLMDKKDLKPSEACQVQLETMFMQFANPELSKIVIKKTPELEWFILATKNSIGIGQISFGYKQGQSHPIAWRVLEADKNWRVAVFKKDNNWVPMITTGKCSLIIDVENPLKTIAVDTPN